MEMHRRFWLSGSTRREPKQSHVVAPCRYRIKLRRFVEGDAIELGVVVRRSIEADHLLKEAAVLGTCDELIGDARVGKSETDLRLVDDLAELARAQHRHSIDD